MDNISIKANAKINLFLEVGEIRPDRRHNIETIMQSVSLCDELFIEKCDSIKLETDKGLPTDRGNLAYRAAELFFEESGINEGAFIRVKKNIPIAAGLAGGSADAAAALKGLNTLYDGIFSQEKLLELGGKLGSDVPFCISGGAKLAGGAGEKLTPCPSLNNCHIVIAKDGEGMSTAEAYGMIDVMRDSKPSKYRSPERLMKAFESNDLKVICKEIYNIFEYVVIPVRPRVREIKEIMINNGASGAMMSGSGPSVFGLFKNKKDAERTSDLLKSTGVDSDVCVPL